MAIPGIGLQSTQQFARPAGQRHSLKGAPGKLGSEPSKNQAQAYAPADAEKSENSKTALLAPVPGSIKTTESTSSRQSLAEIETMRNRYQLQQEGKNHEGAAGKAVQSFLDIADFERKDKLTELVGLDIFV